MPDPIELNATPRRPGPLARRDLPAIDYEAVETLRLQCRDLVVLEEEIKQENAHIFERLDFIRGEINDIRGKIHSILDEATTFYDRDDDFDYR